MSKLLNYLNHLDKNAQAREAFNKDPKAAMSQHGLTEAEQAALLSGDKATIAKSAGVDVIELPMTQVPQKTYKPT